jgi:hypothetical protein
MKKTSDQWERWWDIEPGDPFNGTTVTLRIVQPSDPYGGWSGNKQAIREWSICRPGEARMDRPTLKEIVALEAWPGEIKSYQVTNRDGTGPVAIETYEGEK